MSVTKTAWRPTAKQMRKGPVVRLKSERWANSEWSPHGLAYNIVFDADGNATMLKEHFDQWVDKDVAARDGIRVVAPVKKKPAAPKAKTTTKKEGT